MELNIKALRRLMAAQGYNVASLARAAGVSAQAGPRPRCGHL